MRNEVMHVTVGVGVHGQCLNLGVGLVVSPHPRPRMEKSHKRVVKCKHYVSQTKWCSHLLLQEIDFSKHFRGGFENLAYYNFDVRCAFLPALDEMCYNGRS